MEISPYPAQSEILEQTERLLKSKTFTGSERLKRFLSWTVDRVLRGEAESIKQFTIGREVFDRGQEFDPRIDSIVRTEAQRLRRKLDEYYRSDGVSDPVLISFESGSYAPVFCLRTGDVAGHDGRSSDAVRTDARRPAIAVLPFSNLSADPKQEYFCRGIAESIQERLAKSAKLKVISPISAFRYGSVEPDLARVGRGLHADTIVQGSMRQMGSKARIHAKAIDLASGTCIWAQAFDKDMGDLFAVEDEIARAVTNVLVEPDAINSAIPELAPPRAEAYRLYLRGRHLWNKLTVDGCQQALKPFLRAIAIEPGYAQAYAALADDYHWLIFFGVCNPAKLASLTRRLSLKALQLDRNCAEAYISLATETAALEWQWKDAEVLFKRGLELRPNYVLGYLLRAYCRMQRDDREGSRADVEKALDLDPLSPRSHRAAGIYEYVFGDYESAIAAFDRALELGPEMKNTHYYRGLALLGAARYEDAAAAIDDSLEPSTTAAHLGSLIAAYAACGRERQAKDALHRLHALADRSFVPLMSFVYAYIGLGMKTEALDWLERAVNERGAFAIAMPLVGPLVGEPRFQMLLRRMNLAQ